MRRDNRLPNLASFEQRHASAPVELLFQDRLALVTERLEPALNTAIPQAGLLLGRKQMAAECSVAGPNAPGHLRQVFSRGLFTNALVLSGDQVTDIQNRICSVRLEPAATQQRS